MSTTNVWVAVAGPNDAAAKLGIPRSMLDMKIKQLKINKYSDAPERGRFSAELGGFGEAYHARYWHEREFDTVARVQEIAKQHGTPITTLSVAWVLANPAITSVILGASRVEQLTDTLAAADCKLDSALKMRLEEVSIEFRRGDAGK